MQYEMIKNNAFLIKDFNNPGLVNYPQLALSATEAAPSVYGYSFPIHKLQICDIKQTILC